MFARRKPHQQRAALRQPHDIRHRSHRLAADGFDQRAWPQKACGGRLGIDGDRHHALFGQAGAEFLGVGRRQIGDGDAGQDRTGRDARDAAQWIFRRRRQRDRHLAFAAIPPQPHIERFADAFGGERISQLAAVGDFLAIDAFDHVAGPDAGAGAGAAGHDAGNQQPAGAIKTQLPGGIGGKRLAFHSDPA